MACRRFKNHVMISVGTACDFGKEGPVDWKANPTENQYKEWTWQLNRRHELKLLAHQYHMDPDPQYAQTAAELFTSWPRLQFFIHGLNNPISGFHWPLKFYQKNWTDRSMRTGSSMSCQPTIMRW